MRYHQKARYSDIQQMRRELIKIINREIYIFLATFFGNQLDDGKRRVRDYKDMTMFDVRSEVQLRVQSMKGYNDAKVKHHYEEEKKRQDELLSKLKASMA